ncbi:hypothetical protein BON30_29775 [Cystobacter ferrugineus]|uniref:MftR C-terminal domain-containing protein n=2 Tax=Cystobacter ferrugineus TaxID=83449 RepID=A0A1L9B5D6_9BACT|nr:hypothetical protein BON30_29775 [Cystobacter ferrugineus]
MFEERRARSRTRQTLIAAHAELRERELIKLSSLASAIAESLRERGVARPAASLIAETGIAIFKSAFERWVEDTKEHDLSHHVRGALEELRLVTAATGAASSTRPPTKASRRTQRSSP